MKKNSIILAFWAILLTLTGVLTIYAQDEESRKQFPTLLAVKNDSETIDATIDVNQIPTKRGTVAFIKTFIVNHKQKITDYRVELSFSGIRLEIKDSNGSCKKQIDFDWSKGNPFSGELSCPDSKTKVYYKIEKTVESGATKATVTLFDKSV